MKENNLIIVAPFYRGLLLVLTSSLFYVTLGCIALAITIIITKIIELVAIIIAIYFLMLFSFIVIKIYQKTSKTKIVISEQEIAKFKKDKKINSIRVENIDKMHFAKYFFPLASFDEFNICSDNKRIHFYAPNTLISEIERLTQKKFC